MSDKRGWGWCVQGLYSEVTKAGKGDYSFIDIPNYRFFYVYDVCGRKRASNFGTMLDQREQRINKLAILVCHPFHY